VDNEDAERTADLWRWLIDLWFQHNTLPVVASRFGVSPGHAKALLMLRLDQPISMSRLASELACDPSMVTAIVDRLEGMGLAERRVSATDRRVKILLLTKAGKEVGDQIVSLMYQPPQELLNLPPADLRALRRIVGRLRLAKETTPPSASPSAP